MEEARLRAGCPLEVLLAGVEVGLGDLRLHLVESRDT